MCIRDRPKDVILFVLGKIKADGAVYKGIDFTGSYVEKLNVAGRMVLCNMAVEMGAKTAYIQPNEDVIRYVTERAVRPFEIQYTDDDFVYSESYQFDITGMGPQVAAPSSVDNVYPIEEAVSYTHLDVYKRQVPPFLVQDPGQLRVTVSIPEFAPFFYPVKRRLGQIDVAVADQPGHEAEEKGQKQGCLLYTSTLRSGSRP